MNSKRWLCLVSAGIIVGALQTISAQQRAVMQINTAAVKNTVDPNLHGIFFEEISHGGEGGLYGELIQNRGFEESRVPPGAVVENGFLNGNPNKHPHYNLNGKASDWRMPWPVKTPWPYWSLDTGAQAGIELALSTEKPLNEATPNALVLNIRSLDPEKNNLVNDGFWGINAIKGEEYNLSFYADADTYKGPLTVGLLSSTGTRIATYTFKSLGPGWKKYSCKLTPTATDGKARFAFTFGSTGHLRLDFVSLFPKNTFKNRPNGLRKDLAQYLADLKPAFVRWPGGCYVEGINVESAPNWKTSIGPVEKRPGTFSVWGYWSSDGFGYHEYLQFCEDIGSSALYVFNAGVSCQFRTGTFIPDENLQPVIDDVLDAIEYAVGPVTSKWGKVRAANGHPKPFPLKYLEVGNEQHGPFYARRYNRFHEAIKRKYPEMKIISSMGIGDLNRRTLDSIKVTDIADEHAYKAAYWAFNNYDHFDRYKRGDYEVYVGEYATNAGVGRGNMLAALNDAAYIMGMENNGDLVKMSSYAPLFENVNTRHWPVNLINFDADKSFARISYYTIRMMNEHRSDENLVTTLKVLEAEKPKARNGGSVGLATWDTQTEYKDIEVYEKGSLVYKSDFIKKPEEWQAIRGTWKVQDSAMAQTAQGAQRLMILKGRNFETYTLKLKARKLSGTNAFIIPFAVQGPRQHMRAHIGSYVNANCVFEMVNDEAVTDITAQRRLPKPIEIGRWYDITLEVGFDKVDCYLDGKLLMSYTEPKKILGIAGRDKETGDLIIKVVNASDEAYNTAINFDGPVTPAGTGAAISLQTDSLNVENSFASPTGYVPKKKPLNLLTAKQINYIFPKYSITVLRLKTKG
ncbi:alpha-L-arabinofuranosidase C-terminal domain-containing protein [Segetibacter sp. 3557_3]|uniref:alpha-L-arabinofuranosidase C-terminal domain-containing protein n=1 Tax=Segetibacter sp. 3557_3 TaxID=2547429 RepID=UPI001405491C|nr:alpha-L-arabinofuranosidase C-terminal domain-containing protein [Segetibacter sp. 3557_3]